MNSFISFLRIALGLIFVVAGYVKVQDPHGFALAVANYQLLPDQLVRGASLILAWLELLCGLALVFGVMVRGAALTVTLLMIVFLGAMGFNLQRGLDVACGCFDAGPDGPPLSLMTLLRDVGILLMALFVLADSGLKRGKRR